jgi:hypothetical protein
MTAPTPSEDKQTKGSKDHTQVCPLCCYKTKEFYIICQNASCGEQYKVCSCCKTKIYSGFQPVTEIDGLTVPDPSKPYKLYQCPCCRGPLKRDFLQSMQHPQLIIPELIIPMVLLAVGGIGTIVQLFKATRGRFFKQSGVGRRQKIVRVTDPAEIKRRKAQALKLAAAFGCVGIVGLVIGGWVLRKN